MAVQITQHAHDLIQAELDILSGQVSYYTDYANQIAAVRDDKTEERDAWQEMLDDAEIVG